MRDLGHELSLLPGYLKSFVESSRGAVKPKCILLDADFGIDLAMKLAPAHCLASKSGFAMAAMSLSLELGVEYRDIDGGLQPLSTA